MVSDRGYALTEDEINISLDEFRNKFAGPEGLINRDELAFQAEPTAAALEKQGNLGTIYIKFCEEPSVGVKTMRKFAHLMQERNISTGVFIYQANITPSAMKIIPTILPSALETFQESDLLVNITHHELVPKHILLSPQEKRELLLRYRLKESQLPRIQAADPIAKYLGVRRGSILKILRRSETAGRYVTYRIVY